MADSDNKFGKCCKCPARMSDGRLFTNYESHSMFNNFVQRVNKITNSHHYRLFLQANADVIKNNDMNYNNSNKRCTFAFKPDAY